jgi:integrase
MPPLAKKSLTALAAHNAKPRERPYKLTVGGGLYLEVMPNGSKYWRWKYRIGGKEKRLAIGVFPDVSLKDAEAARDAARKMHREGGDPSAEKKQTRVNRTKSAAVTFEAIGREWLDVQDAATVTLAKRRWILESFLFPEIGNRPISEVTPRELLAALRKVEKTGKFETAKRAKITARQVFQFAILEGKAESDPTASLRGALKAPPVKHHAAITDPSAVGELLRAIDGFGGQLETLCALKLLALTFVRPGELRGGEWSEIDLDDAQWSIPAERMKMKEPHLVPLSTQAVAILREIHRFTGHGRLVFPSIRSAERPMSENTLNAALRRLDYTNDEMTAHGFRALARTLIHERLGWKAEVIEHQLAHAVPDVLGNAYNRTKFLKDRETMMQEWADYLDGLRTGSNVVPIKRRA